MPMMAIMAKRPLANSAESFLVLQVKIHSKWEHAQSMIKMTKRKARDDQENQASWVQGSGRSCRSQSGQGQGCPFRSCLYNKNIQKSYQIQKGNTRITRIHSTNAVPEGDGTGQIWIPPGSEVFLLTTNSRKPAKASIWAQPSFGTTERACTQAKHPLLS